MNRHGSNDHTDVQTSSYAKRARLHALLFTGAASRTALVTPGATEEPKLPPFLGE